MKNAKSKNFKYILVVIFFLLFFFGIYHFSHNEEEEIIMPEFLINTNAEVVVTDVPVNSTTNTTERNTVFLHPLIKILKYIILM